MPAMAVESGTGCRRGGRGDRGAADRSPQPALLRHGRHHRQGEPHPRRPVRDDAGIRGRRRRQRQPLHERHRPSDPRARDRPGRGLGRRRLHRLGGPRGRPARRPEQRGRRCPDPPATRRGGTEPTVTDCNLRAGLSRPGSLLAGDLPIDLRGGRARRQPKHLAEPLGVDVRTAAAAVIDVVNHAMAEALKIVSVQRGHDPREFVLAAFGGAGPMHAAALAEELGIAEVLCPPIPGAFSALGLVGTDLKRDYVRTVYTTTATADPAALRRPLPSSEAQGGGHARSCAGGSRSGGGSCVRSMPATSASPTSSPCPSPGRARCGRADRRSPRPSTTATAPPTATTTAASRCRS